MRSEKRDRRVSPVIDQSWRTVLAVELENRKQLDGGDPEILQIRDLLDHPRISPAPLRRDPRARVLRESGDMHLVDHGRGEGPAQWRVTLPVVQVGVDYHALHCDRIVLPVLARRLARAPIGHDDRAPVRIEEHLGGIETQTACGIERADGPIPVNLPGTYTMPARVPVMLRAVRG